MIFRMVINRRQEVLNMLSSKFFWSPRYAVDLLCFVPRAGKSA